MGPIIFLESVTLKQSQDHTRIILKNYEKIERHTLAVATNEREDASDQQYSYGQPVKFTSKRIEKAKRHENSKPGSCNYLLSK
jgi:hypothetical protein